MSDKIQNPGRRALLAKLGIATCAVYMAPALTTLSTAKASGRSSGGSSGGGRSSGGSSGGGRSSGGSSGGNRASGGRSSGGRASGGSSRSTSGRATRASRPSSGGNRTGRATRASRWVNSGGQTIRVRSDGTVQNAPPPEWLRRMIPGLNG
jgi:hypothetical protein